VARYRGAINPLVPLARWESSGPYDPWRRTERPGGCQPSHPCVRRVTQLGTNGEQPEQGPRSGHREARGVDHPALAGFQLGAGAILVIPGELIVSCFEAARDFVVFTDKRLIAVNVQGMTGKKRDFTSLPLDSRATLTSASLGTYRRLRALISAWNTGGSGRSSTRPRTRATTEASPCG
jgi:hypothetical protein